MTSSSLNLKMVKTFAPLLLMAFAASVVGLFTLSGNSESSASNSVQSPHIYLWAWQRAENLSMIDPHEFGVAYLFCHVHLIGSKVSYEWRHQPLDVPPSTHLIPVVRIDTSGAVPFSDDQMKRILSVLMRAAQIPKSEEVQIDFDVKVSERDFYRKLLKNLRERLDPHMPISITCLTSWCLFDVWIKDLPVSEFVPMMFSLGRDRQKVFEYLRDSGDFRMDECCKAVGVSLEDQEANSVVLARTQSRKIPTRIYVFTRTAWNPGKLKQVKERFE